MKREILRRRPPLLTLANFNRDLAGYVAAKRDVRGSINVNLVTFNRVGEGSWGSFFFNWIVALSLYQGRLGNYLTPERGAELALGVGAGPGSPNLTFEEVVEFFGRAGEGLKSSISNVDFPTISVIYGGEMKKFQLALDLVSELSDFAGRLGKGDSVKFYLLTCNCDLAAKVSEAQVLYSAGRLETVVYNPAGSCGGFADLQVIAEIVLKEAGWFS